MRIFGRLVALTSILVGSGTAVGSFAANAAISVTAPGPATVLEGTVLPLPFTVTNLDPTFAATVTTLTPSAPFTGGDGTDFATAMIDTPAGTCFPLNHILPPGGNCIANVLVSTPALTLGENVDFGTSNVTLDAIAMGGLFATASSMVTVTDPGFTVPEPASILLLSFGAVGAIACARKRRKA